MNTLYNFLTQTYVPQIPNGMMVLAVIAVVAFIVAMVRKNGLIAYFHNFDK